MNRTLFSQRGSAHDWFAWQTKQMRDAANALPAETLLAAALDDLVERLVADFSIQPLRLLGDAWLVDGVQEVQLNLTPAGWNPAPVTSPGHRLEVRQKFEGDATAFDYCPTSHTLHFPQGDVQGDELIIEIVVATAGLDAQQVKQQVDGARTHLADYVGKAAADATSFNSGLPTQARQALGARRTRLEAGQTLAASLQLPVKRRSNPDPSLAVSVQRRRPLPSLQQAAAPVSEPFITDEDYQDIVEFLGSLRTLIERYPETFASMSEEVLRAVLLLILNNTFGPASGETFSNKGKTDIFISSANGPVFIAECKFWRGSTAITNAVDQLVGYLVWRDTKAALVLFVTTKDVTATASHALEALRGHARFVRMGSPIAGTETVFLNHADDPQRSARVALVVVAVPRASPDADPPT